MTDGTSSLAMALALFLHSRGEHEAAEGFVAMAREWTKQRSGESSGVRDREDQAEAGRGMSADWLHGLTHRDWMIDGHPILGERRLEMWADLNWSKAWLDMGPSPTGNLGPYWHVPLKSGDSVHRLYPRFLNTKWAGVVRRAIEESVAKLNTEALQRENRKLRAENINLRFKLRSKDDAA